jgi:hypothetical protein
MEFIFSRGVCFRVLYCHHDVLFILLLVFLQTVRWNAMILLYLVLF